MSAPQPRRPILLPQGTPAMNATPNTPRPLAAPAPRLAARARRSRGSEAGFTLIEALIATALLGFSLIVMFGFHTQALRSNMHARKLTDCTYLAQTYMERMMAEPWREGTVPTTLVDGGSDTTAAGDNDALWVDLEQPGSPLLVNALNTTDTTYGQRNYSISWDISNMDSSPVNWVRVRVRCKYRDEAFGTWHGTTISSYRFRDG